MNERPEKKYHLGKSARILRHGATGDSVSERGSDIPYDFYDSNAESFDTFFSEVLAPYATIQDYAESYYGDKQGEALAVEFGGPARKLFGELNKENFYRRTAGFVLNDLRTDSEKSDDETRHHDVVEADVFFKQGADGLSWHAVEEWTSRNGKPHLAIQRMVQGVDLIRRADLFAAIVKRWLSELADGGTLFAEIPRMMPREERDKLPTLFEELDAEEVVFGSDITMVSIRL